MIMEDQRGKGSPLLKHRAGLLSQDCILSHIEGELAGLDDGLNIKKRTAQLKTKPRL